MGAAEKRRVTLAAVDRGQDNAAEADGNARRRAASLSDPYPDDEFYPRRRRYKDGWHGQGDIQNGTRAVRRGAQYQRRSCRQRQGGLDGLRSHSGDWGDWEKRA